MHFPRLLFSLNLNNIETGKVDSWIAQLKQMNGVDFKGMPVGTAIQMPC